MNPEKFRFVVRTLRVLDAAIAEKVMDWDPWFFTSEQPGVLHLYDSENKIVYTYDQWTPSTSINEAWRVVVKLKEQGWLSQCTDLTPDSGKEWWTWRFYDHSSSEKVSVSASGASAPLTICLAALKIYGIEVELRLDNFTTPDNICSLILTLPTTFAKLLWDFSEAAHLPLFEQNRASMGSR
jgi:hypothetical protein